MKVQVKRGEGRACREWAWRVLWVLAFVALAGCGGHEATEAEVWDGGEPLRVEVVQVERASDRTREEVPGTVMAEQSAEISAKVLGQVVAVPVVPGRRVNEGELLVRLHAPELEARLARAEAEAIQSEIELGRMKKLLESRAATEQEFDRAQASARAAQASLREAQTWVSYLEVRAPFGGVVSEVQVDPGDLASAGTPLVRMYDPETLRAEVAVAESLAQGFGLGDRLGVRVQTLGIELDAEVVEIQPLADPLTRTVLFKLALPEGEDVQPGQFVRIFIEIEGPETLFVPASAVLRRGQLEYVQRVGDGRAWLRLVKTGRSQGEQIELLSGLDVGDTILRQVRQGLRDGFAVVKGDVQ